MLNHNRDCKRILGTCTLPVMSLWIAVLVTFGLCIIVRWRIVTQLSILDGAGNGTWSAWCLLPLISGRVKQKAHMRPLRNALRWAQNILWNACRTKQEVTTSCLYRSISRNGLSKHLTALVTCLWESHPPKCLWESQAPKLDSNNRQRRAMRPIQARNLTV
jgi:hypothetical protein